jgi:hypothetical protein
VEYGLLVLEQVIRVDTTVLWVDHTFPFVMKVTNCENTVMNGTFTILQDQILKVLEVTVTIVCGLFT